MTLAEFNKGVELIKEFLDSEYRNQNYSIAPTTTDNFDKFVAETEANGYITISLEGCENTIYKTEQNSGVVYNILARLWHDTHHLNSHLGFGANDEKIVCDLQIQEFLDWCSIDNNQNDVSNAIKIIKADIVGQLEYYDKFKQFVPNQINFILEYLGVER